MQIIFYFKTFISFLETGCHYKMDLVLVFDSSHSVAKESWVRIKQAAKDIIGHIDISPQGTEVSILVYSADVQEFYVFDNKTNGDKNALTNVIDDLKFYGSWSRLDIALNTVLNDAFTSENGARNNVPKVILIFTDGITDGK